MKIFYAALLGLYGTFFVWYGGSGQPVTQEELAQYIENVAANMQGSESSGYEADAIFNQMRDLVASDNGNEYLMVNLMKYREKAEYPPGSPWSDDPDAMAANDRYSEKVIPMLIKRGAIPVLLGDVTGKFMIDASWQDWDQVAMVRYRSVRDMLDMIVEMTELQDVAVHKHASMEKTHVFPIQTSVSLITVRLLLALMLLILALVVRTVVNRRGA